MKLSSKPRLLATALTGLSLGLLPACGGTEPRNSAVTAPGGAEGVSGSTTAHGTLISADSPSGAYSMCKLDGQLLTATGDDGTVVGAVELSEEMRKGEDTCTYAFSFDVKDSVTYTFAVGRFGIMGGGQEMASRLSKELILVVTETAYE